MKPETHCAICGTSAPRRGHETTIKHRTNLALADLKNRGMVRCNEAGPVLRHTVPQFLEVGPRRPKLNDEGKLVQDAWYGPQWAVRIAKLTGLPTAERRAFLTWLRDDPDTRAAFQSLLTLGVRTSEALTDLLAIRGKQILDAGMQDE